jgi:hypothetical protein
MPETPFKKLSPSPALLVKLLCGTAPSEPMTSELMARVPLPQSNSAMLAKGEFQLVSGTPVASTRPNSSRPSPLTPTFTRMVKAALEWLAGLRISRSTSRPAPLFSVTKAGGTVLVHFMVMKSPSWSIQVATLAGALMVTTAGAMRGSRYSIMVGTRLRLILYRNSTACGP